MQIVRENCDNCVGPTREACNAIYGRIRELGGQLLTEAAVFAEGEGNDVIGIMEMQERFAQEAQEMRTEITTVGCTLTQAQLQTAALSEVTAGMVLSVPDEEDIFEQYEQQQTDRTQSLLDEAEGLKVEIPQLLERVRLESVDALEQATLAFCNSQGWDSENLSFVERMDLQAHLRSEGFKS